MGFFDSDELAKEQGAQLIEDVQRSNFIQSVREPVQAILRDRPLLSRLGRSMLAGGIAAYVPTVLLPFQQARRGAFLFGAGAGFGWTCRSLFANALANQTDSN
eukprot:Protomagalhaensia_wolfi_Nauph_80__4404@NODE_4507_length_557_cov_20_996139_g3609_i0_p1_GENE_NODE_4507_length_557_cov_20_996139_g3609_i0NODE_4507_length_557_cov_20_996139_g3609_i0_p1_ORF_typecomplete_len103_score13_50_NODE_4507_length_557_cov_20_996139_g3609_i0240548